MDPEELVVCPYDPVHRVARKRMQYHLIKCRKVSVWSLSPVCFVCRSVRLRSLSLAVDSL